jgi:hypothetical protein
LKNMLWCLALAGCTLDPNAPTDGAELRVTIVGISPEARHLAVSILQEGASLASFRPAVVGNVQDVWFTEIPLGALELSVATDAGQECVRVLVNRSGLQQEVVDLDSECGSEPGEGEDGAGGEGADEGHEDDHEDQEGG